MNLLIFLVLDQNPEVANEELWLPGLIFGLLAFDARSILSSARVLEQQWLSSLQVLSIR